VNHVIQNSNNNNNNTYYTTPFRAAAANNDRTTTRHRLYAAHALYIYSIAICAVDRSTMVMFVCSGCGCKWRRVYKEWLETFTDALCVGIYNLALIIIYNINIYANSLCGVDIIVVIFYRVWSYSVFAL